MTDPILPEFLVIAAVPDEPLASWAICPEDIDPLRAKVTRGENLVMNGAEGRRPYAPILDEVDVTIRWSLNGVYAPDGTRHTNARRGLHDNFAFYEALIYGGSDPDTGEKDIELHLDDDLVLTAPMQVRTFDPVRLAPTEMLVLTRIVIAAGTLVTTGS
jgi:hypothetical protein